MTSENQDPKTEPGQDSSANMPVQLLVWALTIIFILMVAGAIIITIQTK